MNLTIIEIVGAEPVPRGRAPEKAEKNVFGLEFVGY